MAFKWSLLEGWPSRHGCCKGDFINSKDIYPRRRKEANTSDQKVLIGPIRWVKAEPKRLNVNGNRGKTTYLMRIPVGVKNNHSVGRLQVEAEASSPGAQEENKVL